MRKDGGATAQEPSGRVGQRRRLTRARLLQAAYEVMSEVGVDGAKIKDITERADVGFGTFYSYFSSKDELAAQVLDCIINDLGKRNLLATRSLRALDEAMVMPVSIRLTLREAACETMWQWWARRPDLLVDRMREGFGPFAQADIRTAISAGRFRLDEREVSQAWAISVWMMVGAIHDMVIRGRTLESEKFQVEAIMRLMGLEPADAHRVANSALPDYPKAAIDWTFVLGVPR